VSNGHASACSAPTASNREFGSASAFKLEAQGAARYATGLIDPTGWLEDFVKIRLA
jgi:hypothetical protein